MRKIRLSDAASLFCYCLVPGFLAIWFVYALMSYRPGELRHVSRTLGEWGYYMFWGIMYIKPVSVIFPNKLLRRLVCLRRQLGVLIFYLVALHVIGLMVFFGWLSWEGILQMLRWDYMIYGSLAFILMLILYMTSNNISARLLKRRWKYAQRLAYIAIVLAALHVTIFRNSIDGYILIGVYAILKYVEYFGPRHGSAKEDEGIAKKRVEDKGRAKA